MSWSPSSGTFKVSSISARELFDLFPYPLLVLHPDSPTFTVINANIKYLETTQTQGEKIIGMGLLDLYINPNDLPGCDPDEIVGYLKEFLTTKMPESKRTFRWDVPIPGTKKAHQILECGK